MVPPLVTGALTGGGSLPLQIASQMGTAKAMQEGGMEPQSTPQVLFAGAAPLVAAGLGRLARGVGRTITRTVPSAFTSAQEAAQGAAGNMTESVRPETAASNLFRGARAAGSDVIPAANIQRVVEDLATTIGDNPQSPGLQVAKAFADKLGAATANGTVDLKTLMQLRLDLGQSLSRAPQIGALYGAVLSDLEAAAQAGGGGANQAVGALQAFKQDLGANKLAQMVEAATKESVAGGRGLNIATLHKAVTTIPKGATEPELLRLLGPDKYAQVLRFLDTYRGLPPAMAYTGWDMAKSVLGGGFGALAGLGTGLGGILGTAAGWLGPELFQNARLVGHNPPGLNAVLGTLAAMGRAGMASQNPPLQDQKGP
jgi:hypothetical protein